MLVDARAVPHGSEIAVDVCIVGAGAAGITLARALTRPGRSVAVLESGFAAFDPPTQALADGASVGRPYFPLGDPMTRTRQLGGSTTQWSGECRPLEALDFETRPWVPDSGWPFGPDALRPWYERAQAVCELGTFAYASDEWDLHPSPPVPDPDRVVPLVVQCSPPTRFGETYRAELERSTTTTVHLGANVVEIVGGPGAGVRHLTAATLSGGRFTVSARAFVLASGGIENARLLLVADRSSPGAFGNAHDLVGRYFMEHLYLDDAATLLVRPSVERAYAAPIAVGDHTIRLGLRLTAAEQQRREVTGFAAILGARDRPTRWRGRVRRRLERARDRGRVTMILKNVMEQAPNRESRVLLGPQRDSLGVPRTLLDWRTTSLDRRSVAHAHRIVDDALRTARLGRVVTSQCADGGPEWPDGLRGGRHHMGTTRMHADPRRGVVDADGRVHGVPNLYVAGSSVFPTSGTANPTLTIVALALRLAAHLEDRLT